jgi:hypothetical protein
MSRSRNPPPPSPSNHQQTLQIPRLPQRLNDSVPVANTRLNPSNLRSLAPIARPSTTAPLSGPKCITTLVFKPLPTSPPSRLLEDQSATLRRQKRRATILITLRVARDHTPTSPHTLDTNRSSRLGLPLISPRQNPIACRRMPTPNQSTFRTTSRSLLPLPPFTCPLHLEPPFRQARTRMLLPPLSSPTTFPLVGQKLLHDWTPLTNNPFEITTVTSFSTTRDQSDGTMGSWSVHRRRSGGYCRG